MVRVPVARILVIDDDPEIVDILVTCLCGEGYGVVGALTSDEGLKLVGPRSRANPSASSPLHCLAGFWGLAARGGSGGLHHASTAVE